MSDQNNMAHSQFGMTEDQIAGLVEAMCLTWRPDFNIIKTPEISGAWLNGAGMIEIERNKLRKNMRMLVTDNFLPRLSGLGSSSPVVQPESGSPNDIARPSYGPQSLDIQELDAMLAKLEIAKLASCRCLTKTPEVRFHQEDCLYRLVDAATSSMTALRQACATLGNQPKVRNSP